ncbi:MAG TPA: hypothetical protein VGU02_01940 [Gaiellaceae bacterium]|nr:hypothetical protein [Gaiellaceae bacterium]
MSFFRELPDPPTPPRSARDPRLAASRAELPVGVPLALAVARNDRAALVLGPIQVFSDGFEVGVNLVVRAPDEGRRPLYDPFNHHHGQDANDVVRLALVFADGTSAEALHGFDRGGDRTMMPQSGSGSDGRWVTSFWCWPLPPPGAIDIVCAWPAHGLAETRTSFDAGLILEAAKKVERLWEDPPPGPSHSTSVSMISTDH